MILAVSGWGEGGASSCRKPSMPRAAKGTAASTSSQPQAVMDSSADTSAPLAYQLAGGRRLLPWDAGFSIGCPASKSSSVGHIPSNEAVFHQAQAFNEVVLTRTTPDRNQSAPGAGTPTGDFWKRSGQHEPRRVPGHGAPSSKSSSQRCRPVNEAFPTRTTPDRNQSAPGAGAPTGDFWERSGQHEPRRVPGRGVPPIEAVFHQAQAFNEAVFCHALPVLFSRQTCPTLRRTPPPAAAAPAHPGSSVPPTARNRAMAHP